MLEIGLLLVVGLGLLMVGGDLLVRGAVQAAAKLGVSPLVIGLTLVGFGTSTPELVTSVQAGLSGAPGIAYGNVVGSNIANILLIAGISALLCPIIVARAALRRDAVVMLLAALVFSGLAAVWPMGRLSGAALVIAMIGYITFVVRQERQSADTGALHDKGEALAGAAPGLDPAQTKSGRALVVSLLLALGGLVLVVVGGAALVNGAVALARSFEISETVIGLTIVAVGTSMPELVTSVIAALKRQGDVAFGNVVGSNIYNILGIGGTTALIAPSDLPGDILRFDAPVMILVSAVFVLFAATGLRVGRREGAILLAGYGLYIWMIWPQ